MAFRLISLSRADPWFAVWQIAMARMRPSGEDILKLFRETVLRLVVVHVRKELDASQ